MVKNPLNGQLWVAEYTLHLCDITVDLLAYMAGCMFIWSLPSVTSMWVPWPAQLGLHFSTNVEVIPDE